MKQHTQVALIGGNGKSGKYILKNLLAQGFSVKLLLRHPEKFQGTGPSVQVVPGDVRNLSAVQTLLNGCSAVISALGQPVGESSVFSQATRNIIEVMEALHIKRYILITGLNVDTPFDKKGPRAKYGTNWMKANYPETTTDKQVEYETLVKSHVDWTLVRLPMIEQIDTLSGIKISLEDCPGDKISASDLANFLVAQLDDTTYNRKAPFIASVYE